MARLARIVAERSARREAGRGRGRPPRTFALLAATPGTALRRVAERLASGLDEEGGAVIVDRDAIAAAFARAGVADAGEGGSAALVLGDWLDRHERAHERLFYLADPGPSAWTDRCLRQADRIVLIAEAGGLAQAGDAAERAREIAADTPLELLLIRPDVMETPSGTAAWLDRFAPAAHHHARLGVQAEMRSAARRIAGRGRILVLSGGGARGYVHIGLLTALDQAGIEIDAIAGTSMGALVGGSYAMARSATFAEASARRFGDPKRLVDRTLPLLAIARTRGVTTVLRELFGDVRIEDLPVPFFCVAADLSHAVPHLFDRGPLWRAVRGSSAIPGVFTPILVGDALIVDGGVMNNFPVDLARERFGDGPLIASNAYGIERPRKRYDFPDHLSGWALLWQKTLPKSLRTISAPSILSVLTQATSLHSHYRMDRVAEGADLLVRYPTDQVGSLEFERGDELIETGHRYASEALGKWSAAASLRTGAG
jgi:predicted acylesterase/phospholipase RssA